MFGHPELRVWAIVQRLCAGQLQIAPDNSGVNIEQAIVLGAEALRLAKLHDAPIERARASAQLAECYRLRCAGDRAANLDRAAALLAASLGWLDPNAYPADRAEALLALLGVLAEQLQGEHMQTLSRLLYKTESDNQASPTMLLKAVADEAIALVARLPASVLSAPAQAMLANLHYSMARLPEAGVILG